MHNADVIQLESLRGRNVLERVHIDERDELVGERAHRPRRLLHREPRSRLERPVAHPADPRLDLARHHRRIGGIREHVATRDVDVVGEADRHRHRRNRSLERPVDVLHRRHLRPRACRQDDDLVARTPDAAGYFISLDVDCLDPAIAPGVAVPRFGGLTYFQVTNLLKGLATRGPVIGASLVGIVPAHDLHGLTSLLGARLILNLLGALAHADRLPVRRRQQVAAGG